MVRKCLPINNAGRAVIWASFLLQSSTVTFFYQSVSTQLTFTCQASQIQYLMYIIHSKSWKNTFTNLFIWMNEWMNDERTNEQKNKQTNELSGKQLLKDIQRKSNWLPSFNRLTISECVTLCGLSLVTPSFQQSDRLNNRKAREQSHDSDVISQDHGGE